MKVKWMFFDIGETLVDEHKSYDAYFAKCCHQLKINQIEVTPLEYREKVENCYKNNVKRPLNTVWKSFNMLESKPKWSNEGEVLYDNVPNVLEYLSKTYHLGVIANQTGDLENRLKRYGIHSYFDVIISSGDVGVKKPNQEIFEKALLAAGIQAEEAIYVGDRVDNDMIPAKKVGMKTIRVKQGMGQYHQEDKVYPSDLIVTSISDLLLYE